MSKIKIEQIKSEAEALGWTLVSTEYKNLQSEIEFTCPEGHQVITTYALWRARHSCPVCDNPKMQITEKIKSKKKGEYRILALDQATHTSGWAIFSNDVVIKYGALDTEGNLDKRINSIKIWLINMIDLWQIDKVVLEDIQLQEKKAGRNWENDTGDTVMNVNTYKTLAQLQGVLIDTLFEKKIEYQLLHTGVWREICQITGKYRADKKKSAQLKVIDWFGLNVSNDIADAICIGYAAAKQKKVSTEMLSWD